MGAADASEQWQAQAVLEHLRAQAEASGSGSASAQIFLQGSVVAGDLEKLARNLVSRAAARPGIAARASVGRISRLAKSFSLTAEPDVFAALAIEPAVKAILPSSIEDIFPKPVKVVPD